MALSTQVRNVLKEGLTKYEDSVKRMKTAKPSFAEVFEKELADIAAARQWVNEQK